MNFLVDRFRAFSVPRKIALSFMIVILVGGSLLTLPIANRDGQWLSFVDGIFTATSATCVTGLVVHITAAQFTLFGQIVILLMIQIGGLGLMTIVSLVIIHSKTRLSLNNRLAMKELLNHQSLFNIQLFIRRIVRITFCFEGIGAVLLMFRFIPEFGVAQGIFNSIFTSVSAFCNAGFDNYSATSLMPYVADPLVNFVIMGLIVFGGLGFTVWVDLGTHFSKLTDRRFSLKRVWRELTLNTKIVLVMSGILIFIPALAFLLLEMNNPETIGLLSFPEKVMACLFQSITLRTAGFASIDPGKNVLASKLLMIICMFIGGSPGGTAGGIKTTTFMVAILFGLSQLFNHEESVIYKRTVPKTIVQRALTIIFFSFGMLLLGVFVLTISEPFDFIDILFEATSAIATVGLTTGVTPSLSLVGKLVIIGLMFMGRIGAMTLIISIMKPSSQKAVKYPSGNIIVG